MSVTETIEFQSTPEFRKQLEAEAARLDLSVSAYILYLVSRSQPGVDAERANQLIREVFGKHGDVMRRLAQ